MPRRIMPRRIARMNLLRLEAKLRRGVCAYDVHTSSCASSSSVAHSTSRQPLQPGIVQSADPGCWTPSCIRHTNLEEAGASGASFEVNLQAAVVGLEHHVARGAHRVGVERRLRRTNLGCVFLRHLIEHASKVEVDDSLGTHNKNRR
eukprot:CAMPEP_0205819416 /NCGR_PEP_ID=MMETSP0206-20130828/1783_1 /ASSEMBLY_ACC=CAM_ASM_000279 /TAXON_ID=36767 /ORGANISM="Euplotes focardii, Strain TN1" /LENGTH=146 /DNA_ID=CAMNT_0053112993 /DNA_START=109 /DNA_END=548 /DNA_ORIENTATION=+